MKNKPYTYLIGWSKLDTWYYGCRWSKDANPDDLWKTYFTSSKYVKEFAVNNGNPDIIEVRKVFYDADACRLWEHKVLRRMMVSNKTKWLNKTDSISIKYDVHPLLGTNISEETKKKISEKAKLRFSSGVQKSNKGKKFGKQSAEFIEKRIAKLKGQKRPKQSEKMLGSNNPMFGKKSALKEHSNESIQKMIQMKVGKKRYNNGIKNKMFYPNSVPKGWNLGSIKKES